MKYVKEHINEKFTEDSDPIRDLDIGYKESYIPKKDYRKGVASIQKQMQRYKIDLLAQHKIKINAYFNKKFVGKTVTGNFTTEYNYTPINRTIKIKRVEVLFYYDNEIRDIILISDKGKKYEIIKHEQYTIRMS